MEAQQEDFWRKFHDNVAKEHRMHIIQGSIMAPALLVGPFIFLWILGVLIGR